MLKTTNEIDIQLVSADLWDTLMAGALTSLHQADRSLDTGEVGTLIKRVASAVIAATHSRHVGVTPEIAVGLGRLIVLERAAPRYGEVWDDVTARLRRELRRTLSKDAAPGSGLSAASGFVLRDAPVYTILRLALPLCSAACAQIGRSVLACADQAPGSVARDVYENYQRDLHVAIKAIAASDEDEGAADEYAAFWAELALTYASGAMRPSASRETPALPETNPMDLAWLLRLTPDPEPQLKDHGRPIVVTTPLKRQRSRRLNEGGVTGYKLTRRLEELGGIVHSELIYPPAVLLDRVLNSGYLTIERPPRHQKRRDVLVVGMLPPQSAALPVSGFAKACWFDCVWRFAVFLRNQELYRSEIRWIESDRIDRARSVSYALQDLPMLAHDESFNPGDRWMFLKALRWVPSFLNRRDRYVTLTIPFSGALRDGGPPEAAWCRNAWAVQRDNPRLETNADAARPWRDAVDEFAHVHLMIFMPSPPPPTNLEEDGLAEAQGWRRVITHFVASLGIDIHTSITWLPPLPTDYHRWRFVSEGRSTSLDASSASPPHVAGRLEQVWLDRFIEDTCRE